MDGATPYPLHRVRWILRSVASLFLLLSFSLYTADGTACVNSINAINNSDFNDGFIEDPVSACWTDPLFGDLRPDLIVVASMIWNTVEFITLCVNRKGIHPGAHIGLDILLSFALLSAGGISFYDIASLGSGTVLGKYTAAAVFATIAGILHFTLFILNAISVHKLGHTMSGNGSYNGQAQTTIVYQQPGAQYASLPPPPPGMAYLVPMNGMVTSYPANVQTVPLPKTDGAGSNLPEVFTTGQISS